MTDQLAALHRLFYGHAEVPGLKRDLETAWRAIKAIAAFGGALTEGRRERLLARMSAFGTPVDVVDRVLAWDERERGVADLLVRAVSRAGVRWQVGAWVIYEALSVAMADGDLAPNELEVVLDLAPQLYVIEATACALAEVCRGEAELRARRIALLSSREATNPRFDLL